MSMDRDAVVADMNLRKKSRIINGINIPSVFEVVGSFSESSTEPSK